MTTIVELKKSDIKGFWKNSKLYRKTFSSKDENNEEQILKIDSKYLNFDISKLQKSPQLKDLVKICKYWGVNPFNGGIFSQIKKMSEEDVRNLECCFLQDIFDVKNYFEYENLRDVDYQNIISISQKIVGYDINGNCCIKLGEPVITKRFRNLNELINISASVKNIRMFLNPRQMEDYFSRMWPNQKYDFDMSLIAIINEDIELLKHIWYYSFYNTIFRLKTSSNIDKPKFSMSYLSSLYIDYILLQKSDVEKIIKIENMIENQSTTFSYDSFAGYMGKINILKFLSSLGVKFNKFTLMYAKMQNNTICVDYITSKLHK